MKASTLSFLMWMLWMATPAGAQQGGNTTGLSFVDIMPTPSGLLNNVVIDSQVTRTQGADTRINLHLSCYATNLRNVANPVAENSVVTAYLDIYDSAGAVKTMAVQFPAEFLKPAAERNVAGAPPVKFIGDDMGAKLAAYDNTVQIVVPGLRSVTLSSAGEVTNIAEKNLILTGARFSQTGAPGYGNPYTGVDGPLSSNIQWYTSVDGKNIDVHASFPGAATPEMRAAYQGETRTGFCGSYYSPLMIFFDTKRPQFTGKSDFQLRPGQSGLIHWPEAGSAGYFLVKGDKVQSGEDLFGDSAEFKDGFANLASHDQNKDGRIDSTDPIFKSLRLWRDVNGDGKATPNELSTLGSHGVESIQVNFTYETKKFGDRAEYRQRSDFKFRKSGKMRTGEVLDMWFSPALGGSSQ